MGQEPWTTCTKGIALLYSLNELYRDVILSTLLYSLRHAILKLHTDFLINIDICDKQP